MKRTLYITSLMSLLAISLVGQVSERGTQRIIKEVRHEILMLPYFEVFDNISFRVDGYKVTLLGQVTRPTLKKDAESAVKSIEPQKRQLSW